MGAGDAPDSDGTGTPEGGGTGTPGGGGAGTPGGAQPPDDSGDVRVGPPARTAGGLPALAATVGHLHAQAAVVRGARALAALNQADGFDCPGCAWPEPHPHRSDFEFCENGAKAVAWEATSRRADAAFFARHSVAELAARSDHWLGLQGRLTEPLVLPPGASHYQPIAWDDAFALVARELAALDSPERAVFYTSGRTSNEAAFLYQLFVRQLGSNNLPDCSNMCHESSGVALRETLGVGKGTVQLDDFARADAIFIIGQNPGTNHPRMLTTLQEAARRGCPIVSINPLPEAALVRFRHPQHPLELLGPGTAIATLHLPVRVGGDVALLKGIMKEVLAEEARAPGTVLDRRFIEQRTEGFAAFRAALDAEPWALLEEESGVERALIQQAAAVAAGARRLIACWAMGLTQHRHAVANIQEVVNLLLLGGHLGRPGAGACPVRGHSNVQGDRTMGIWEKMDDAFLDRLGARFGFAPPRAHGLDTVGAIRAMHEGRAQLLFALGGNFLSATPDTERTAAALRRCRLTAHVSTKLNRSHLVTGATALILPCLGRSERDVQASGPQFVTVEDSMSQVHRSEGRLAPASPRLLSEPAIVCGLARAALGTGTTAPSTVDWEGLCADYDRIRDHIAAVVPGFDDFNRRVRGRDGFELPNPVRAGRFPTAGGRARFTVHPTPRADLAPDELLMMTIRSHDQFNTTIYGLDDRYRGVRGGRRVVLVNPTDIAALGLEAGALVDLESRFRGERRRCPRFVVVPYPIPRRCAATYFPEANALVPLDAVADKSNTPASKSVAIALHRVSAA
jgi:molybdopterin-dependent oxidoreductase alpha subunit